MLGYHELTQLGRWTTYYVLFDKSQDDPGAFDLMKGSLQDHNIEINDIQQPRIISGVPPSIWPVLDPPILSQEQVAAQKATENEAKVYRLPFEVRYQLEVCISREIMNVHNLTPKFVTRLAKMAQKDETAARNILEYAAEQEKRIYDPMAIFNDAEALAYSSRSKIPYYCAYSRKAIVTPTTLYFSSPTVETTNRVIRKYVDKYGDRFIRVQFTDEIFEVRILMLLLQRLS
jgi:RNA-dependent RNA polymerase